MKEWLVYEVILLNKILRNHFLSENMQLNYASFNGLPLIISCTRSWNLAWHLLWRSTTESKNIVKLLAMSQISHTVCYEDDYFPKGNLNYLRANVSNFRESVDSREFLNFFIFRPNNLYSTLISKKTLKLVTAFYFFRNQAKFDKL